jgi:hypothetical protein
MAVYGLHRALSSCLRQKVEGRSVSSLRLLEAVGPEPYGDFGPSALASEVVVMALKAVLTVPTAATAPMITR